MTVIEPESKSDYNQIQVKAAKTILLEMTQLLSEFPDGFLVCGGWVPDLLIPDHGHVGSIDVDLLLNSKAFEGFASGILKQKMQSAGYQRIPEKFFAYHKTVEVEGNGVEVEVDFLSGKYGQRRKGGMSQHVSGIRALPADGGAYAFTFPATQIMVEAKGKDGQNQSAMVPLVSIIPFFTMKISAMKGRDKNKDAYDLYFLLQNWDGGFEALAQEFRPYREQPFIQSCLDTLGESFASLSAKGPSQIVDFLELTDSVEIDQVRQDAFQRVREWIRLVME